MLWQTLATNSARADSDLVQGQQTASQQKLSKDITNSDPDINYKYFKKLIKKIYLNPGILPNILVYVK